jgi:UDPglucose 6-dehydrogenase
VAATDVNETMPGYIANKAQDALGSLKGKRVAVLGLAFKAGTSDARRSPGVKVANVLAKGGATVCAYDPQANGEAKEDLRRDITVCKTHTEAVKDTDAVFITTEWPELISLDPKELKKHMHGDVLVDCMNMFDKDKVAAAGLHYIGVGR